MNISIVGIDEANVTTPRNDGTRGSALYTIPLKLSEHPPAIWNEIFSEYWRSPPSFTNMHRPGIASVSGDRIVLNGTTMEEVEKYHLQTLKVVIKATNEDTGKALSQVAEQEKRRQEQFKAHRSRVSEISARLDFDTDD